MPARSARRLGEARGYKVVENIAYPGNTTEVTSEVQRLKAANPDVVFQLSYTSDALLFVKTYQAARFQSSGLPRLRFRLRGSEVHADRPARTRST